MARIGANKASCKKYKDEGVRGKNKKRKQERHLKRLEYFANKKKGEMK